jgi:opacity protein-like surface antigen
MLLTQTAGAEVLGDVSAGGGFDYSGSHSRLGLRGGIALGRTSLLVGADWADAGDEPGEDYNIDENRYRLLGRLAWRHDGWLELFAGAGAEYERSTNQFLGRRMSEVETSSGFVAQAGAAAFSGDFGEWNLEPLRLGLELAVGYSAVNRTYVDLSLVVRLGR